MAEVYYAQQNHAEAQTAIAQAVAILDQAGASAGLRCGSHLLQARVAWQRNLRREAVDYLRQAMQLAEQQRVDTSGSAHERAETFAYYNRAFEQMVAWQLELKDMDEALAAMERSRARSLLDEMTQAGVDLYAGRTEDERQSLAKREAELKQHIQLLQRRIEKLDSDTAQTQQERADALRQLLAELATARKALYEHYRDVRSSNPVFRRLLSAGGDSPSRNAIQQRLATDGSLPVTL